MEARISSIDGSCDFAGWVIGPLCFPRGRPFETAGVESSLTIAVLGDIVEYVTLFADNKQRALKRSKQNFRGTAAHRR
jgi:hypothetical protein